MVRNKVSRQVSRHLKCSTSLDQRLLRVSATAIGSVMIALAAVSGPVMGAQCTPTQGTSGNDIINCVPGGLDDTVIRGFAGDDQITFNGNGTFILGDDGNDTVNFNGGTVVGDPILNTGSDLSGVPNIAIEGGNGDDTINLDGGQVGKSNTPTEYASVSGGAGINTVNLRATTVYGSIRGDFGKLILNMTGGSAVNVFGGTQGSEITVNGAGAVVTFIAGGNDSDDITLLRGQIGNLLPGLGDDVASGLGNDTITVDGATVLNLVNGNDGNDTINLFSGILSTELNAGNKGVLGELGNDIINLKGTAFVGGNIFGSEGNDELYLVSGEVVGQAQSGADDDVIIVGDPTGADTRPLRIRRGVSGFSGSDTIRVYNGELGGVFGEDFAVPTIGPITGNDFIYLYGGTISAHPAVAGVAVDGGSGSDLIQLGGVTPGGVTSAGSTVLAAIRGGAGVDTINLISGTAPSVDGGADGDIITLAGAVISGTIAGGAGGDTIDLTSGTAGSVDGGADGDIIGLSGAAISGTLAGGAGTDTITLATGTAGSVDGGDDVDTINLDGAAISGAVQGGTGADVIAILRGSTATVDGGAGNDTINLTGGTISSTGDAVTGGDGEDGITLDGITMAGKIAGGADVDTINIVNGSVNAVDGGTGADKIYLRGGVIDADVSGGDDNDEINLGLTSAEVLTAGSVVRGSILGGVGDDTIKLAAGSVAGADGGAGADTITITGASISGAVSGGDGNDSISWQSGSLASINGGRGSDSVTVTADYTGIQTLDGGDDALATDGEIDELTISNKTVSTSGSKLVNWEKLSLDGGGLTLTDGAIAVGGRTDQALGMFLQNNAYLRTGGQLNLDGNLSIAAGSKLEQLSGNSHTITGNLANLGDINLQDTAADDVLNVGGNYAGGGTFMIDINGDVADRMVVAGNVSGVTQIVTNVSGEARRKRIDVVKVTGNTAVGDFTAADFVLGPRTYSLQLNGKTWQFVSDISDSGSLYPAAGGLVSLFAQQTVSTRFQRSGAWSRARAKGEDIVADGSVMNAASRNGNVWLRGIGQWADGEGKLTAGEDTSNQVSYDRTIAGLQGGLDLVVAETDSYLVTAGLFGQGARMTSDAQNRTLGESAGSAEADGWGIGGKLGVDTANAYAEVIGGWNLYNVTAETDPGAKSDTDGNGHFLSIEAGREFALSRSFRLIPQAQLAWLGTDINDFVDSDDVRVGYNGGNMAVARAGLAVDALAGTVADQPMRLTAVANYWYQFGDGPEAVVDGTKMTLDQANGSIEGGVGFHWGTENAPIHLHGEVSYRDTIGGDGESAWNATAGARVAF
jgi:outer membrane autotransporter protein